MADPTYDKQRKLALAALLLADTDNLDGPRPTHEELWDWMHGKASQDRAAQIKQYLAHDQDLYEEWRQLRLALDESTAQATTQVTPREIQTPNTDGIIQTLGSWLNLLPNTAIASGLTALCLVAVIALQLWQSQSDLDFWENWQVSKSTADVVPDKEAQHVLKTVLTGMQKQMDALHIDAEGPLGQPLPGIAPDCTANTACIQRRNSLLSLGSLLVRARAECLTGAKSLSNIQSQVFVLHQILVKHPATSIITPPLRLWTDAIDDDRQTQCAAVESLIARALTGF